jgi:MoxR-like ATPase
VTPDDVKAVTEVVLAHRLAVSAAADMGGRSAAAMVAEILGSVPVPVRAPSGVPAGGG